MEERLQKILSEYGLCSRREAERMMEAGRVQVNGVPAVLGQRADPDRDEIRVDGRLLESLGAQDSNRLQMINSALDRIKQGTYGRCLVCKEEIPEERLEAIPYAFMCIDCQSRSERQNR